MMETDPNGIDQKTPGAKLDNGKPKAGLIVLGFGRALLEVAKVGTFGAAKYSEDGWLHVTDGKKRYMDAVVRHLLMIGTEKLDGESNLSHLAHAAWNILACLELEIRETLKTNNGG